MESKMNLPNYIGWYRKQPYNKWISISEIPEEIFLTVWNNHIETWNVKLHPYEARFKKVN